jgi:hypothetical protein
MQRLASVVGALHVQPEVSAVTEHACQYHGSIGSYRPPIFARFVDVLAWDAHCLRKIAFREAARLHEFVSADIETAPRRSCGWLRSGAMSSGSASSMGLTTKIQVIQRRAYGLRGEEYLGSHSSLARCRDCYGQHTVTVPSLHCRGITLLPGLNADRTQHPADIAVVGDALACPSCRQRQQQKKTAVLNDSQQPHDFTKRQKSWQR